MLATVPATAESAARETKKPRISPSTVPRAPIARPSARNAAKITARPAPIARSVAISGRRRSTAIETALEIRKIPTSSVSEPSAFRLKRKARTMRSAVSAARPGESSDRPRGRRRAISRRAVSRATPGRRTTSTRSTRPALPSRSCAVKTSVRTRSPPAAPATPESSTIPPIRTRRRFPPATSSRREPGARPRREASRSDTKIAPRAASAARAPASAGAISRTSRTAPSPPQSIPRIWTISRGEPSRTAGPVTAGASEPSFQTKARDASVSSGTPAGPLTTKSLFPESRAAALSNEAVTLRLAW